MPIYIATLGAGAVELAGEVANGLMAVLWPAARVAESKRWAARGRAKAPDLGPLDITIGVPTFIGETLEVTRGVARQNLVLYTGFPFFQNMFRHSGFAAEAAQMEKGAGPNSLSDRLLDAVCLLGPVARCRDQLAVFSRAGADLPILYPPIGVDAARAVIRAFRR